MTSAVRMTFGRPTEWDAFSKRNPEFIAVWPHFEKFIDQVFSRTFTTDEPIHRVVFTLGRLAVEDFMEILLVVGNGYGVAGLKLLRTLFERVVTMMYLIRHPEEVETFLDFHWIHLRKALNHLKAEGGDPTKYYPETELREAEARYQAIRHRYEVLCSKCGHSLGTPSWTKRDLATLAKDVGVREAYLSLYYWPTLQLHTTTSGMALRLEETEEGVLFKAGAQQGEADAAVLGAHTCLAILLEEQCRFFALEIDIGAIRALYQRAWGGNRDPVS